MYSKSKNLTQHNIFYNWNTPNWKSGKCKLKCPEINADYGPYSSEQDKEIL